ncbi:hypothetical protein PINS_up002353 [Pythium insidiosum]|nr:hypothetical protein PINS_up002353 [Pythium insidiosum]
MVSAREAREAALRDGALEKKRRTGGWKKRFFVLTTSHFYYFDSAEASEPRSTLATFDILTVDASASDPQQRGLVIHLYRKKKEYRAATTEERDAWLRALESVAAFKKDGSKNDPVTSVVSKRALPLDEDPSVSAPEHTSTDQNESSPTAEAAGLGSGSQETTSARHIAPSAGANGSTVFVVSASNAVDLPRLCDAMKKAFSKQVQTSKSFASQDVIAFVMRQSNATREQALDVGQQLIDAKLIVPLKSHIFEDDGSRFKFADSMSQRAPKNHLNMRAQSIQDLMGSSTFNPTKYTEDFLRKHSSEKIEQHCERLIVMKEKTIDALKEEISVNYTSFIRASTEIKTMENSVSQLKALVMESKRSLQAMKSIQLDTIAAKKEVPSFEIAEKKAQEKAKMKILDAFICDLEVALHEHAFEEFTTRVLEYKTKLQEQPDHATASQKTKIEQLIKQFIGRLVDEFNASMQTSERMHKKEDHLRYLIQLGEPNLATEMCLQNYSVRIALQLRHVPSYGNALNYVINLSRTFFTSLLVCYEDYEHSFRGQKSSHFIALTVWISAQLERFANEVMGHIFPNEVSSLDASDTGSTTPTVQSSTSAYTSTIDVSEYKNVTKFVSNALRYVFYGSRQLELAGLPTAHCLAPHLVKGIVAFIRSYSSAIKSTFKEEIKRERWEMMKRTIRDAETKQDREIILTQSARSFYSMIQQFLRDVQRVLNPSCATSNITQLHEIVVDEADNLLIRYSADVLAYLESPKTSSSLRLKHVVGILTNVAYVQDDCVARSTLILNEFLPKAALQNRELEPQNAKIWRRLIVLGMQRGAQSLMKMSIAWQDLDLSEDALPELSKDVKSLFVGVLLKELHDISNDQLEKLLRKYRKHSNGADDTDEYNEDQVILATMVLEGMLVEMTQDETWWQQLRCGTKEKRIGLGGVSRFCAELRVLSESAQSSEVIREVSAMLAKKLSDLFLQLHPGRKDTTAPESWATAYMQLCLRHGEELQQTK